jgi:hypothetical protein
VDERLHRAIRALTASAVTAVVIGARAVAYWVSRRDEGAVRNTPNVDLLIDLSDAARAQAALDASGFVRDATRDRPLTFLDGPDGSPRQAVQVWFVGDCRSGASNPCPRCAILFPLFLSAWSTASARLDETERVPND